MDSHEDNAGELLQRIVDLEESDKETSSLIVFLLMQYMSRPEHVDIIFIVKFNFNLNGVNSYIMVGISRRIKAWNTSSGYCITTFVLVIGL